MSQVVSYHETVCQKQKDEINLLTYSIQMCVVYFKMKL